MSVEAVDPSKYKEEYILQGFDEHTTNKQMCSVCNESIPMNIKRLSMAYKSKWGTGWIRICERCVKILNKKKNLKNIKKWEKELVEREFVNSI